VICLTGAGHELCRYPLYPALAASRTAASVRLCVMAEVVLGMSPAEYGILPRRSVLRAAGLRSIYAWWLASASHCPRSSVRAKTTCYLAGWSWIPPLRVRSGPWRPSRCRAQESERGQLRNSVTGFVYQFTLVAEFTARRMSAPLLNGVRPITKAREMGTRCCAVSGLSVRCRAQSCRTVWR